MPLDGSISVTVVQFSGIAQIEFPFTVISTQADLNPAKTAIGSLVQIGGSTGPGLGINAASQAISSVYRPTALQSFCPTTDGTTNTGPSVGTTVNSAKASAFGLDSFSVIAIEDPSGKFDKNISSCDAMFTHNVRILYLTRKGGAFKADFERKYGPQVFNGGDVFTTRVFVEFANTVGALCFPNDAALVGIEVTQTVQDLENSVSLVGKKPTIVHAYFEPLSGGPPSVPIQARLIGRRGTGGAKLPGTPLTASFNPSITAQANALDRRKTLSDSLNFKLPASWILPGTVEFEVEAVGTVLTCEEEDPQKDCKVSVTFTQGHEIEVRLVPITFTSNGITYSPPTGADKVIEKRLEAILPVVRVNATTAATLTATISSGQPTKTDIVSKLQTLRADECTSNQSANPPKPCNSDRMSRRNVLLNLMNS